MTWLSCPGSKARSSRRHVEPLSFTILAFAPIASRWHKAQSLPSHSLHPSFTKLSFDSVRFLAELTATVAMGKPLGLLHRIFSFSKASKRSNTKFDLLQPADEHGRTHEHEDPLLAAGSIRTTGGIGGHGRGITNTASEMTPGKPLKDGERGMKKRRLKRASLSASNLLSWGQDRADKTERIPSNGSQDLVDKVSKGNEAGITTSTNERMHCGTPKASKHVESEDHEDNRSSSGRRESGRDEQFTRLLRSSSTNYKVISETDYRTLDPIGM